MKPRIYGPSIEQSSLFEVRYLTNTWSSYSRYIIFLGVLLPTTSTKSSPGKTIFLYTNFQSEILTENKGFLPQASKFTDFSIYSKTFLKRSLFWTATFLGYHRCRWLVSIMCNSICHTFKRSPPSNGRILVNKSGVTNEVLLQLSLPLMSPIPSPFESWKLLG